MNLQRLSSRNMLLRASVLSKLVSTPSRMPTSIQSAQSHRFMGDYFHLYKCQMTSSFFANGKITQKVYGNINKRQISRTDPSLGLDRRHEVSLWLQSRMQYQWAEIREHATEPSSLRAWFRLRNFGLRDGIRQRLPIV